VTNAPELIRGGSAVDDRGEIAFINELDLSEFRRCYIVSNHDVGFVRAWHGHRFERKAAFVVSGAAVVCAVEIDDWDSPSPDLHIHRYVLSERNPSALIIPAGFANGFMTLASDTRICFLSSSSLEDAAGDDIRFAARTWDPWSIEER
jgi:dTDP-4-dehydrorhamnose 3,5-epimerase-like enzyme